METNDMNLVQQTLTEMAGSNDTSDADKFLNYEQIKLKEISNLQSETSQDLAALSQDLDDLKVEVDNKFSVTLSSKMDANFTGDLNASLDLPQGIYSVAPPVQNAPANFSSCVMLVLRSRSYGQVVLIGVKRKAFEVARRSFNALNKTWYEQSWVLLSGVPNA